MLSTRNFKLSDLGMLKVKNNLKYHVNVNPKNKEVVVLISDKVDFKIKKLLATLHNDKRVTLPKRHSNTKHVRIFQQRCKICEMKTERTKKRD